MEDEFHAIVDVFAVPEPKHINYYKQEWTKKPLFSCKVIMHPLQGGTDVLHIKLKHLVNDSLIAIAPYDGDTGVHSVVDSPHHFVFTIRKEKVHAWLGIEFKEPGKSTLFSLAIQKFMQRRIENTLQSPCRGKPEKYHHHRNLVLTDKGCDSESGE